MPKKFQDLTLTNNFMFFKLCTVYPNLCKHMLELILGKSIKRIEQPTYEKVIDLAPEGKSIRLDVYMNDDVNTVYDLEMQTTKRHNLPKRSRYYQGLMDLNLLEKGDDYDKLPNSLVIFICTFDYYGKGFPIYSFENRCEADTGLYYEDQTRKVIVNLSGDRASLPEDVCAFFNYLQFNEISDDFTKEMDRALCEIKTHHEWEVEYMNWNTYEMDLRIAERRGHEQGLQEGLKEGLKEGIDSVFLVLNRLRNGESPDSIIASGVSRNLVEQACRYL